MAQSGVLVIGRVAGCSPGVQRAEIEVDVGSDDRGVGLDDAPEGNLVESQGALFILHGIPGLPRGIAQAEV